ncbi:MAG TPA: hypothetical protein VHD61_06225 [Lacunisphaera sp.]|nr:hypothetical protein [Lacunisphaera sp.]
MNFPKASVVGIAAVLWLPGATQGAAPAPVVAPAGETRLESAQDLAQFMTYYYRQPRPELVTRAIEVLAGSEFLPSGERHDPSYQPRARIVVGFFGGIFASHPEKLAEWRQVIERRVDDSLTRKSLHEALELASAGAQRGTQGMPASPYTCWGEFLATGDQAFLRALVDPIQSNDGSRGRNGAAAATMMLLAYNAPYHPLVGQVIEAARAEATARGRELLDDLLHKDLAAVGQEARNMTSDATFAAGPGPYDWTGQGTPLPDSHQHF